VNDFLGSLSASRFLSRQVVNTRIMSRISMKILFLGLLLLSSLPFMAVAVLLLLLERRGSVIFRQTRIGKDQQPFTMYKFRTMSAVLVNSTSAEPEKGRISVLGRILRDTKFDELPQLMNIFRGEMNLLGPRPLRVELHNRYTETIPNFERRYTVLPGITGLSQILDLLDENRCVGLACDLFYIRHRTFKLKVWIFIATAFLILCEIVGKDYRDIRQRWLTQVFLSTMSQAASETTCLFPCQMLWKGNFSAMLEDMRSRDSLLLNPVRK
jgi:lipopolysaccharide/colanic/teichoic acid biosynthesis glycosyltransferase